MLETNSILTKKFLNAVQTAYTLHAKLNRPDEIRRQQSRAWWPMAHVGNVDHFRCSMEKSFRDNELLCSEKYLSWLIMLNGELL